MATVKDFLSSFVVNFVATQLLYVCFLELTRLLTSTDIFPYPYDIRAFLLPIQKRPAPIAPVTCPGTLGRSRHTVITSTVVMCLAYILM